MVFQCHKGISRAGFPALLFMLLFLHGMIQNYIPSPIMKNIVIFRAHVPKQIAQAKRFLERGHKVVLHTTAVTKQISALAVNPMVQLRMGDPYALTQMALLVVE